MKKLALGAVVVLVSLAKIADAQGASGVRFGLSGGADFPVSDQRDVYKTGWNGTAST